MCFNAMLGLSSWHFIQVYKVLFIQFSIEIHTTNLKSEKTQHYKEQSLFYLTKHFYYIRQHLYRKLQFCPQRGFWSISICYFKYLCAGGVSKGQGQAARWDVSEQRAEGTKTAPASDRLQRSTVKAKTYLRLVIFHSSYQEKNSTFVTHMTTETFG